MSQPSETFVSSVKAILPPTTTDSFPEIRNNKLVNVKTFNCVKLKALLFAVSNNFLGVSDDFERLCLNVLRQSAGNDIDRIFESGLLPGSKSLAINLFKCAIGAGDTRCAKILLRSRTADIAVNDIVCVHKGQRWTPTEMASFLQLTETAKALLQAGADVQKTYANDNIGYFRKEKPRGALECMIDGLSETTDFDGNLTTMLLDAGAPMHLNWLKVVIRKGLSDFAEILFRYLAPCHYGQWDMEELFYLCVDLLDTDKTKRILRTLSSFGFDVKEKIHSRKPNLLFTALQRKQPALAKLLIQYGVLPDENAMRSAVRIADRDLLLLLLSRTSQIPKGLLALDVRRGDHEIMQSLIDAGVSVDDVIQIEVEDAGPFGESRVKISALSEAIRQKDVGVIRILEACGASKSIHESRQFKAVLVAASSSGNLEYVQALLHTWITQKCSEKCMDSSLYKNFDEKTGKTKASMEALVEN